jgi:hypothetical protein
MGVHLKNVRRFDKEFASWAGFACLWLLPILAVGAARGEWGALLLAALPAAIVFVGKCFQHFTPEDYVILHADRMEFPLRRGPPEVVSWSDVQRVRWPKRRDRELPIVLSLTPTSDRPLARTSIALEHVSPADRLVLIRYLRLAAEQIEQTGWPQFCRNRAVPLIETADGDGQGGAPKSPAAAELERVPRLFDRRPFLAGMLVPLILVRLVSRQLWWMAAAMVAVSGVINIRLAWGFWAGPFTQIVFGSAATLFCLGVLAPVHPATQRRPDDLSTFSVIASLSALLIGVPFLSVALLRGWLWLPPAVLRHLDLAVLLVLLAPAFLHLHRRSRYEKQNAPTLEAAALARWEAYIATGILPTPDLTLPACGRLWV